MQTKIRYRGNEADRSQRFAKSCLEMARDVIVAGASPSSRRYKDHEDVPVVRRIDPSGRVRRAWLGQVEISPG